MTNLLLLVEDTASDEKLTLLAFKHTGATLDVVVVRDGAEALTYLHGDGDKPPGPIPSLILLDLKLPKIEGLDVLRRLRAHARTRLLPVIILSASNEQHDIEQSYASGANAFVRKPVDFFAFEQAAKNLVSFWLKLNEPAPRPSVS